MKYFNVNGVNGLATRNVSCDTIYKVNDLETLKSFITFEKNRATDNAHIKKIQKAMSRGIDVGTVEIELNTFGILEGQNRTEAAKRQAEKGEPYELEVRFKDLGGDMGRIMEYIKCVNTTQKKWKDKDYVEFYREEGNDYDKLVEWAITHSLTHNVPKSGNNKGIPVPHIQQAAFFVKGLSYRRRMLKEGLFRASQSDFEYATEMHNEVKRILDDTDLGIDRGNWFQSFVQAWIKFRSDRRTDVQINKLPNGVETLFNGMVQYLRQTPSTQIDEWEHRFQFVLRSVQENTSKAA